MRIVDTVTTRLSRVVQRHMPESFVVAVGLTLFTLILAMIMQGTDPITAIRLYGDSFWSLLAFSMQIAMLLLSGYMLANTPVVDRALTTLASRVGNPRVAVALVTFAGALGSWLNAGFGLVIGAILAQKFARTVPGMHYPLAVAGGYAGFSLYGIGLSGTIPLTIASPGHFLEEQLGIIPTSETVFDPIVFVTSIVVIIGLPLFVAFLHPRTPEMIIEADPTVFPASTADASEDIEQADGLAARLGRNRWVGWLMGALGLTYAVIYFSDGGAINFDIINLVFLFLGILLFGRPDRYLASLRTSINVVSGVLVQYPMYAGIMGVLAGSGLMVTFAGAFVATSSAETLPFFSFLSGGIINILAPSGGAQWAVQGPVMIEAAQQMGADLAATSVGVAMGDQWTNVIQPFWIIPVLAITGIRLRDVMGYLIPILVFLGIIYGSAMLLMGFTA